VTLADTYRLLAIRQEFHHRHLWEWITLAENQWNHDGRELKPGKLILAGACLLA
jgi:hypothetical protein